MTYQLTKKIEPFTNLNLLKMTEQKAFTLVNPQNGNLAFKLFSLDGNNPFDHIQRLNYYSILLIREGNGKLKADFSQYDFSANSMLCFSPYQPFMIDTEKELQGMVLHFHSDFFCIHKHQKDVACNGVLFNDIYNPPCFGLETKDIEPFYTLMENMKAEVKTIQLAHYEVLISYLKIFLITASRIKVNQLEINKNQNAQKEIAKTTKPFILHHLKEAIEEYYKTKHTASEYAALLNISSKALAKITKEHFNKTLTHLISERIIIEAKRELYMTSKTVKQIAYELGYEDEHYFSRFFKNNADISPQFFRDTVGFARAEN